MSKWILRRVFVTNWIAAVDAITANILQRTAAENILDVNRRPRPLSSKILGILVYNPKRAPDCRRPNAVETLFLSFATH
jgi:hypothetical protein